MTRFVYRLADLFAILGGLVLSGLVILTVASVLGRWLFLAPLPGDFEIVEAAVAFSIFSFLPYCQVRAGHATVDVFTSFLGAQPNRIIVAVWEFIFALVLIVIAWRLFEGMQSMIRNGQTSMFLQFPTWWAYAACMVAAAAGALTGVWSAWDRLTAVRRRSDSRPLSMASD